MVKKKVVKKKSKKVVEKSKKVSKKTIVPEEKRIEEISWNNSLSVGEKSIDKQHQGIILQIQDMEKNLLEENPLPGIRKCIHFLDKYIVEHFSYEEAYMKKNKFPGLVEHVKIHRKFSDFYEDYKKELTIKLTKEEDVKAFARKHGKKIHIYLGKWLINHINGEDRKYCRFISPDVCGKIGAGKGTKKINVSDIAKEIRAEQVDGMKEADRVSGSVIKKTKKKDGAVFTGIEGFDELLTEGIPKGSAVLVAGGAGSGKTIFSLQTLFHQASKGKKCLYMSFEEREDRLIDHMNSFGWEADKMIKKGKLKIMRINPFDITRNVDALLAKQKGELLIDIDPVIIPKGFKPDFIALDSLTAIASAFTGKEENYRIYIEQLFRFFEKIGATSFLITETEQIPKIFSKTGVEEFLADGVVVIYNLKHGNVRENALEILKLRGAAHEKKIVAMEITGEGIVVYPEQEVFSEI
ncbi:hypothetical protein HNV12_00560 [Methanococcoides sp. SA1]|nr:hypothetical protein [Methanococcoides sp. SA1]